MCARSCPSTSASPPTRWTTCERSASSTAPRCHRAALPGACTPELRAGLTRLGRRLILRHSGAWATILAALQGSIWDGRLQVGSLLVTAHAGTIEGIDVILLRPDWGRCNLFRGKAIYGGSCSELEAYLFLSRCVSSGVHSA